MTITPTRSGAITVSLKKGEHIEIEFTDGNKVSVNELGYAQYIFLNGREVLDIIGGQAKQPA